MSTRIFHKGSVDEYEPTQVSLDVANPTANASAQRFVLPVHLGSGRVDLGVRTDVDAPSGQTSSQPGILPLAANRQ